MCGRSNPGLWGFAPVLRRLGADLGFVPLVIGACVTVYALTLLASGEQLQIASGLNILAPSTSALLRFGMAGAIPGVRDGRLVDASQRELAARQPAAHPVQHDVGARSRAGDGRHHREQDLN